MAKTKFHFVEDYQALVRGLIARYPLPEAMSRAVGGLTAPAGVADPSRLASLRECWHIPSHKWFVEVRAQRTSDCRA